MKAEAAIGWYNINFALCFVMFVAVCVSTPVMKELLKIIKLCCAKREGIVQRPLLEP